MQFPLPLQTTIVTSHGPFLFYKKNRETWGDNTQMFMTTRSFNLIILIQLIILRRVERKNI